MFCLLIVCCSCRKRPRRIVFNPQQTAAEFGNKKQKVKVTGEHSEAVPSKSCSNDEIVEREAGLADIPIPPKATPLPGDAPMVWNCEQDRASLINFYKQQMANFGWRVQGETGGVESLLLFKKPDRRCIISLRNGGKHCATRHQLVITILKNKEPRL